MHLKKILCCVIILYLVLMLIEPAMGAHPPRRRGYVTSIPNLNNIREHF